jgi:hypothetical protein
MTPRRYYFSAGLGAGVFYRHDGFFSGIHAAYRGAVIMILISTAYTLQESDAFWTCMIGRAMDVSAGWATGRKQALILQACDDIRKASKPKFF